MINKKILKNLVLAGACLPILGATVVVTSTSCNGSETPKVEATITGETSFDAKQGIQTQKQYTSDIPSSEEVKWSLSGPIPNGVEINSETGLLTVFGCPAGEYTITIKAESINHLATIAVQVSVDILDIGLLTYNITSVENKTVEVTGLSNTSPNPSTIIIPEKINLEGKEYTVTTIRESAFENCSSLTSVTIGNGVQTIGKRAFIGCESLTSVTIGNGVKNIAGGVFPKEKLTTIFIGSGVESIENNAFNGCSSLASISVDAANPYIGEAANIGSNGTVVVSKVNGVAELNADCSNIVGSLVCGEVVLPNTVTSVGERAFYECSSLTGDLIIPNSVESIGGSCFAECSGLTSVTIGNGVQTIGYQAFLNCSSLPSIAIPNSVTSIGGGAFLNCSGLTSVTIPNSVTSIGGEAFRWCKNLRSIVIPNSVTSIGENAFAECSGLASISVDAANPYIGEAANIGSNGTVVVSKVNGVAELNADCSNIVGSLVCGEVVLPNTVTSVGERAFIGCESLTSVTIGSSVESIGERAFFRCASLTGDLIIPNSVESIGGSCFAECSGLTSVTIGNGVQSIHNNAFENCSSLTSVTIGNGVQTIGYQAFLNCTILTSIKCSQTIKDLLENNRSYYGIPAGCVITVV